MPPRGPTSQPTASQGGQGDRSTSAEERVHGSTRLGLEPSDGQKPSMARSICGLHGEARYKDKGPSLAQVEAVVLGRSSWGLGAAARGRPMWSSRMRAQYREVGARDCLYSGLGIISPGMAPSNCRSSTLRRVSLDMRGLSPQVLLSTCPWADHSPQLRASQFRGMVGLVMMAMRHQFGMQFPPLTIAIGAVFFLSPPNSRRH